MTSKIRFDGIAAAAILSLSCQPTIASSPPPGQVVIAQFDPTQSAIPLPNDLVLHQSPASLGLNPAQTELIAAFQAKGGFPNDQEAPITIGFTAVPGTPSGTVTPPQLDLTTFTPSTFFVTVVTPAASGLAPIEPLTDADYVLSGNVGTLTIHHLGRTPWPSGEYAVFIRGGPNGVKTTTGDAVNPSQIFYLIEQGQDLTAEQNIGLLAAQAGSVEAALPLAQQLNGVISLFQQTGAFTACDAVFPHQELAVAATFAIQPPATQVELDPQRGLSPLPIDLLRSPGPTGTLTPLAACTLAQGQLLDGGQCSSAAAAGFAALDGFSTTGAILAPTNNFIQIATVTSSSLQLYDLTDAANPVLVSPTTYIAAPCEFASTCAASGLSTALAPLVSIQPAGATAADPTSVFRTRPLKDATDYAVVIADGVLDQSGHPLQPGTAASILQFTHPLVDSAGHSQLTGVDDATAASLEVMRLQLVPVLSAASSSGIGPGHVAMAYTFRTQTILTTGAQLAALPYEAAPAAFNGGPDGGVSSLTAAAAFSKYGVDPVAVPSSHIGEVIEAQLTTPNLLDPATGAFLPNACLASPEVINAIITVPATPAKNAQGLTPAVLFRHGLGSGRLDMLTVADTFASKGIILAAIDAAKHGDRSLCNKGSTTIDVNGTSYPVCADGAACVSPLPAGAQGDAQPPGTCTAGFTVRPVSATCATNPTGCMWNGKNGIPLASGNFLISANFFRSRDSLRQDFIDQSQLVHVLAPIPPSPIMPNGNPVFDHLLAEGIVIDPASIGYIGQSLGSIQGAGNVATNPRITTAVLNVGGATAVDVFTNSPAFTSQVGQLLQGLGVVPGTAGYLEFLVVAKTILDPADPVNFAGHIQSNTLPNLLATPAMPQAPKTVLAQMALCDQTVPNPFGYILDANLGTGPLPGATGFGAGTGTFEVFITGTSAAAAGALAESCSSVTSNWVDHGFLTEWTDPMMTGKAQIDAATFLLNGTKPNSVTILP
jgi:hypothetical protein